MQRRAPHAGPMRRAGYGRAAALAQTACRVWGRASSSERGARPSATISRQCEKCGLESRTTHLKHTLKPGTDSDQSRGSNPAGHATNSKACSDASLFHFERCYAGAMSRGRVTSDGRTVLTRPDRPSPTDCNRATSGCTAKSTIAIIRQCHRALKVKVFLGFLIKRFDSAPWRINSGIGRGRETVLKLRANGIIAAGR